MATIASKTTSSCDYPFAKKNWTVTIVVGDDLYTRVDIYTRQRIMLISYKKKTKHKIYLKNINAAWAERDFQFLASFLLKVGLKPIN